MNPVTDSTPHPTPGCHEGAEPPARGIRSLMGLDPLGSVAMTHMLNLIDATTTSAKAHMDVLLSPVYDDALSSAADIGRADRHLGHLDPLIAELTSYGRTLREELGIPAAPAADGRDVLAGRVA